MKASQYIWGSVVAVAITAGAGIANAATFQGTYDVAFNDTDPGLVVSVSPDSGPFGPFNLGVGDSTTFHLFDIWTDESWVNADDEVPKDISVAFDFSAPQTSGTLSGSTFGVTTLFGLFQEGQVEWNNPLVLSFGPQASGQMSVTLSNQSYNWGIGGLWSGEKKGAKVYATISYDVAPIPLPAAGWMLLAGLGGLVALRRRQKAA